MRHWRINLYRVAVAAAAALLLVSSAGALDKIRTASGIGYPGEIVGVAADGIEIKVGGAKRVVPFGDITSIQADDYPELDEAEKLYTQGAQGDADAMKKAADLYDDMDSSRSPDWLRTIVQWRMYGVYATSGEVRKALDAYLGMAKKSPKLVVELQLPQPKEGDSQANQAMLKEVDKALGRAGNAPYVDALKQFRLSLLLLEGDPGKVLASGVLDKLITSKDPKVRRTAMLRKLELLLAADNTQEAVAWFTEVKASDADIFPEDQTYWEGRLLQAQGEHVKAALAYMRVPVLYPQKDRNRTADALWRAGQALEAVKAPAQEVQGVYQEAVTDYPDTTGAARAKRELARLGAK